MSLTHIKAASMLPGKHGLKPDLPLLVPTELPAPKKGVPEARPWKSVSLPPFWKFENAVPAVAFMLFACWLLYMRSSKTTRERYRTSGDPGSHGGVQATAPSASVPYNSGVHGDSSIHFEPFP